jgi:hypothetical protein
LPRAPLAAGGMGPGEFLCSTEAFLSSRPRVWWGAEGRGVGARHGRRNVILDWAVNDECGNTASPCIRSGARTRYPNLLCTGESKAQKRRDPSDRAGRSSPWVTAVTRLSWVCAVTRRRTPNPRLAPAGRLQNAFSASWRQCHAKAWRRPLAEKIDATYHHSRADQPRKARWPKP